jgi:hypothetical protein
MFLKKHAEMKLAGWKMASGIGTVIKQFLTLVNSLLNGYRQASVRRVRKLPGSEPKLSNGESESALNWYTPFRNVQLANAICGVHNEFVYTDSYFSVKFCIIKSSAYNKAPKHYVLKGSSLEMALVPVSSQPTASYTLWRKQLPTCDFQGNLHKISPNK